MKMLGKLARSLAARYVCQNCEKEKERRAVAHNATKCLERNTLLAESNQAASIEIHRLEKALAKAELERIKFVPVALHALLQSGSAL